jgi:pimeloyl-ACP methyl ester carboxylesterase
LDLRGHGDSDATFTSYDDVTAGSDVLALIDRLDGPAVVIGNSMGAGAGVWAAERPGQVAGLALIGPFVRYPKINPLMQWAFRLAMSGPWVVRAWLSLPAPALPVPQARRLRRRLRVALADDQRLDHVPHRQRVQRWRIGAVSRLPPGRLCPGGRRA